MANIVTWEYYSSLYNNLKEEDFPAAEAKAEQAVRSEIGLLKWAGITPQTFGYTALQDCVCNVINKMTEDEKIGVGKGITAVNNDGYSENFSVSDPEENTRQLRQLIKIWLSGSGLIGAY